jgi:hypothetical protein
LNLSKSYLSNLFDDKGGGAACGNGRCVRDAATVRYSGGVRSRHEGVAIGDGHAAE